PAAAHSHAVRYPPAAASAPHPSGPRLAPTYTPVWAIEVAAAGACGWSCTTATFTRPGKTQPSPNPSTTPTTSGTVPGAASSASPTAPATSSTTTTPTSPRRCQRSTNQPAPTRAVT